jgi:hypothetical protein
VVVAVVVAVCSGPAGSWPKAAVDHDVLSTWCGCCYCGSCYC